MLTQNFQNLFHIEIDSPHRKKLNHTCYWGMEPAVLFDSVGMFFFFGIESVPDERIKKIFV